MENKIKILSIVVYCNGDFEETKETIFSIIDQKISHVFYDVYILNDNANKNFTKKLNEFLKKEELLLNYQIFSFSFHTGMPLTLDFLIKNNIIKSKYFTLIKSGDVFSTHYLFDFVDNYHLSNHDVYIANLKEELIIPRENINKKTGKDYDLVKSKIMNFSSSTRELSKDKAFLTKPIFLGKIWSTKVAKYVRLDDDRILYQDIFLYFQLIMFSNSYMYLHKYAGTTKRNPWFPERMDKRRIELLSNTLNKMVSRDPYLNGHVLQLLACALIKTSKEDKKHYLISNYKLFRNYKITPIYGISKRKVIKQVKPILEFGKIRKKRSKKLEKKYEQNNKKNSKK